MLMRLASWAHWAFRSHLLDSCWGKGRPGKCLFLKASSSALERKPKLFTYGQGEDLMIFRLATNWIADHLPVLVISEQKSGSFLLSWQSASLMMSTVHSCPWCYMYTRREVTGNLLQTNLTLHQLIYFSGAICKGSNIVLFKQLTWLGKEARAQDLSFIAPSLHSSIFPGHLHPTLQGYLNFFFIFSYLINGRTG